MEKREARILGEEIGAGIPKKDIRDLQDSGLFVPAEACKLTSRQEEALYHGFRSKSVGCQAVAWNPLGETKCPKCGKVF